MFEKQFPYRAQSRLDLGVIAKDSVEKGVKPSGMTPISGEDRGLKPQPMTPSQAPAQQPVNAPAQPKN